MAKIVGDGMIQMVPKLRNASAQATSIALWLGVAMAASPLAAQRGVPPAAAAAAPAPSAAIPPAGFVVRAVSFDESRFLARADLDAVARPYLGRPADAAALASLVAAVDRLYDTRGLETARAMLASQSFAAGAVHVSLVEGRVGRVSVSGNRRLTAARAIDRAGLVPGATVDLPALRHRLALLNRVDDTQLRAALQPSEAFGTTDIQLSVTEPRRDVVELVADNAGYDSAGRYEGSAYYRRTGVLGTGDRFTGFVSGSAGLLSGTAAYDAPLFGPTTRLALSYGHSRIDIVDGRYAALQSRGLIDNETATLSRPLASGTGGLLVASLTAGISATHDYLAGIDVGRTRTHRAGGGLSYGYAVPGTTVSLAVTALYADAPLGRASEASDFAVVSGLGSAEHLVGRHVGLRLAGGWQVATASALPSDLLFQVGGATTIRGYRQGALTGDGGYYLNAEAELFPSAAGRSPALFAFVDQGRIFTRFDQDKAAAAAGLGASAMLGRHVEVRLTGGLPLQRVNDEAKSVQLFARLGLSF